MVRKKKYYRHSPDKCWWYNNLWWSNYH